MDLRQAQPKRHDGHNTNGRVLRQRRARLQALDPTPSLHSRPRPGVLVERVRRLARRGWLQEPMQCLVAAARCGGESFFFCPGPPDQGYFVEMARGVSRLINLIGIFGKPRCPSCPGHSSPCGGVVRSTVVIERHSAAVVGAPVGALRTMGDNMVLHTPEDLRTEKQDARQSVKNKS